MLSGTFAFQACLRISLWNIMGLNHTNHINICGCIGQDGRLEGGPTKGNTPRSFLHEGHLKPVTMKPIRPGQGGGNDTRKSMRQEAGEMGSKKPLLGCAKRGVVGQKPFKSLGSFMQSKSPDHVSPNEGTWSLELIRRWQRVGDWERGGSTSPGKLEGWVRNLNIQGCLPESGP